MWLSSTFTWCIAVFMTPLLTECYPRTFQQEGPLTSQQLLSSQYQATIPPKINEPVPQRRQKTVSVYCHEDALEVVMNVDLFGSGFPVYAEELWLGSSSPVSAASCGAVQTGESQLTISAYFRDCGTKLSVSSHGLKTFYRWVFCRSPVLTGHKPVSGGFLSVLLVT